MKKRKSDEGGRNQRVWGEQSDRNQNRGRMEGRWAHVDMAPVVVEDELALALIRRQYDELSAI